MPNPHSALQTIARNVLLDLGPTIRATDTEASLAARAIALLADRGMTETWYYACPAFVLLGSRSCLSISGRDYVPADEPVGQTNLVTIDLSPCLGDVMGDCARSFCIENGQFTANPAQAMFRQGVAAGQVLHQELCEIAHPDMTCDALHGWANRRIAELGFRNLDFLGNVGHSISRQRQDRCFIEAGQQRTLGQLPCFTFEPHIAADAAWGFKHEDIYAFEAHGRLAPI